MLRVAGALAALVVIAACSTGAAYVPIPRPSPLPTDYGWSTPISTIVVDDYASGGILTVPPGTHFALELSGGGWTINLPESDEPYVLVSGPGSWNPDLGFVGPGNCDSASPCGGIGAVFAASNEGYGEVTAWTKEGYTFDLHLQVKNGPITLDLQAVPIINESISTGVTAPIGATVNVHLIGNWGPPKPNDTDLKLFAEEHMSTEGVVEQIASASALNEAIYSYRITGKGGYAYDFKYRDPSVFASEYEIAFDIR